MSLTRGDSRVPYGLSMRQYVLRVSICSGPVRTEGTWGPEKGTDSGKRYGVVGTDILPSL